MGQFNEQELESRIDLIRKHVARPIPKQPWDDNTPALIPFHEPADPDASRGVGGIIIGSARHASNLPLLQSMNVAAVLNCASGGIARLPVDELKDCGIRYAFTNCRRDSYDYPILHEKKKIANGGDNIEESYICSQHLEVASELFCDIRCQNNNYANEQRAGKKDATAETATTKSHPCNILFFCVAGQNRSAALAVATMIMHGKPLEECLKHCADKRPFVLENIGFQRQIVELESILHNLKTKDAAIRNQFQSHWTLYEQANKSLKALQQAKKIRIAEDENGLATKLTAITDRPISTHLLRSKSEYDVLAGTKVEIELLIPGLFTMEVRIPRECTIPELKRCLIQHANDNLLSRDVLPCKVAKAWVVMAMFGYDDMYDIPLEVEAVELKVQLKRIKSMFGLTTRIINGLPHVVWNEKCRFALVIFSVVRLPTELSSKMSSDSLKAMEEDDEEDPALSPDQVPWTFCHEERSGAPSTLLENTLRSTHLRAWDFVTGEALASSVPTVFSFAEDFRDKRAFMMMSKSANTLQQFCFGGEGDVLGMGENAIVHRVRLSHTTPDGAHRDENWTRVNIGLETSRRMSIQSDAVSDSIAKKDTTEEWDAAVKRPFSLAKMLSFLQNSSEAGLAKRLRLANLLNSDKRVLYFYGLGLGLSTNAYNQNEYKFELMLLSKYEEEFSTYTMREFMEEYVAIPSSVEGDEKRRAIQKLQSGFTITSVKVFLVSLLNAFRDLTLMGVQAFDFNHLNNVLVSRDYRQVRLIDIDGNAQGSIDYPAIDFANGSSLSPRPTPPQRPCLDVDLNILLPSVIEQLMLGKGRGKGFVTNKRSEIWRAKEEDGKEMLRTLLIENFYSTFNKNGLDDEAKGKVQQHVKKLAEWFYALLKKQPPWNNWTHDIYDAMRCIDHLPIS